MLQWSGNRFGICSTRPLPPTRALPACRAERFSDRTWRIVQVLNIDLETIGNRKRGNGVPDPTLSIVTVTLDNIDGLRTTLQSVEDALARFPEIAQAVEIVVKDGGSSDGTLEYLNEVRLPGLRVASGADGGIYEAMNDALSLAGGRWILFLNAGDRLTGPEALGGLLDRITRAGETNLIYADCLVGGRLFRQSLSLGFLTAHMINHQSICYAKDLLEDGYDTRYRFCADYAHLLAVYPRIHAEKLPKPICVYDAGGRSSDPANYHRMWRERLLAVWRSPLSFPARLRLSSRGVFMWPIQYLRAQFT